MTTRPRLKAGSHLVRGLAAVALFVVMAGVFATVTFGAPEGFPEGANITASIGYAMFNLFGIGENTVSAEAFLAVFEIIDVVLVAALVGAVMLASRSESGSAATAIADGGRRLVAELRESGDRDDRTETAEGGER